MKVSIKVSVMTIAHRIKSHFSNFATALRAAWQMAKGHVSFAKKDTGEVRNMQIEYTGKVDTNGLIKVIEVGTGWRSFYLSNIIL